MKLIKDGCWKKIDELIKEYESKLVNNLVVTICSADHLDHIAAFFAWSNVGGNIFIKAPFLTEAQSKYLDNKVSELKYRDALFFHTSGTTGTPKIAVHQSHQMSQMLLMSSNSMWWQSEDVYLNLIPPFTVGFWHMVLTAFKHHNFTMVLGSRETLIQDLESECNVSIIVPALLDQIKLRNIPVDFSKYNRLGTGSAAVLERHHNYFFNNGGRVLNNLYGTTEVGVPILKRTSTRLDNYTSYLDVTQVSQSQFKIENNILYIKGESLCSNIHEFECVDGWFKTNDIWTQEGNMIRFNGRSNDIIKLNGFQANLLEIETVAEDHANLGDSIAVVRNSLGSDWIELFYTNKEATVDKNHIKNMFKNHITNYSIPKKFTWIETIPRNGMGKKIRY